MKGEIICHKTTGKTKIARWAECRTTGIGTTTILRGSRRIATTGILRIQTTHRILRILGTPKTAAANRSRMLKTIIRKTITTTTISDKTCEL